MPKYICTKDSYCRGIYRKRGDIVDVSRENKPPHSEPYGWTETEEAGQISQCEPVVEQESMRPSRKRG